MSRFPYHQLYDSGELARRVEAFHLRLSSCKICPRHCEAKRFEEEEGFCQSGRNPIVSASVAHFGEEPVLVGKKGAGNIFFGSCNLRCVYCQNWQISHPQKKIRKGELRCEELAQKIIDLQNQGCHNINFVSPSHFVAQMVEAIYLAIPKGLKLPIVYNTNAYDDLETLRLLEGIVDIYLPDLKYSDDKIAFRYSQAKNYTQTSRLAIREMFRQVGLLQLDVSGLACRGLIVRHLILPNDLSQTEAAFNFLAKEISPQVSISVMAQYYPAHQASKVPLLSRHIRSSEYQQALDLLDQYGLENGWVQELQASKTYQPDFSRERPFDNGELQNEFPFA